MNFAVHPAWQGIRITDLAAFTPQKTQVFCGFSRGWSIVAVARSRQHAVGESHFLSPFPQRRSQPTRENRGTPAPHGVAISQRDWLVQVELASRTGV